MDAQLDRQRAKLRKLATHMITIRDTIDRLARDIQRAVDSKCGSEVFKTLSRQADCMQHRLEEQADKQTTGQKKLVNLLHAKQDFCDWSTDLGVKISTIYKMTGRVFDHYDRASKIMALLTGAADLERQQQGSTSSSASTRLDHFNKLASELVLAVGDIEGFKKAETSFRQLLESVLGSDEGEGQKEDESRDDVSSSFVCEGMISSVGLLS